LLDSVDAMVSVALALSCLACIAHGRRRRDGSLLDGSHVVSFSEAARSERRIAANKDMLGALLFAASQSSPLRIQESRESPRQRSAVSMSEEVYEIGEYRDPTTLKFRSLLNFFGTVTVGLGPVMKPLTESFKPSWGDEDSQVSPVKLPLPMGMGYEASGTVPGVYEVNSVAEGSNAEAAGLKRGDLIRGTTAMAINVQVEAEGDMLFNAGGTVPTSQRCLFVADGRTFDQFTQALASNAEANGGPGEATLIIERWDPFEEKKKAEQ